MPRRVFLRYLAYLFIVPVLAVILPFVAERAEPLQGISASRFGRVLDYSYKSSRLDGDVVIFGDSSAMYGIDTVRLSGELGLRVINLPGTMGSLPVTGDLPLRKYLAFNRSPQLIVFYFTPWNLNALQSENQYSYEGDEQILRHGTVRDLWHLARTRPQDLIEFPMRFYSVPRGLEVDRPPAGPGARGSFLHEVYALLHGLAHTLDPEANRHLEAMQGTLTQSN